MVAWEETRTPGDNGMKESGSGPIATQTREEEWAAKLIEEDPTGPAGQREFGISYRPSEYRRVVDIQEKLRIKGVLKDLSKPLIRDNGGVKEEAYGTKFAEALKILDGVIANPGKHAEVLSGFTKEKDLKKAEIVQRIFTSPLSITFL